MARLLIAMMLLAFAGVLSAQSSCCHMKVTVAEDSPAELTVVITNSGQSVVGIRITAGEYDFKIRVTSTDGKEANLTEYGRRLRAEGWEWRKDSRQLNSGESFDEPVDLRQVFDLKPGTYNVSLAREVTAENKPVQLSADIQIHVP